MKPFAPLLLVLALAACAAPNPWMSPSVPKEQWDHDYAACRYSADRVSGWRDDGRDNGYSPTREYERAQAKRMWAGEVEACMRGQGYILIPKK